MKLCLQVSPLRAAAASNRSLCCCNVWPVALKAGDNQGLVWGTQKRQDRHPWSLSPWQGLAAAAWREQPALGALLTQAGRSQVPGAGHGEQSSLSAGPCWGWCLRWSPQGKAPPCTGTWLMEGWRAHRAFPSQESRPCAHWGCKTCMEHGLCNQCVALSKARQDMLQTPRSSQTYPSLGNCCMQTPTLAMAIKTRNGLHLIPLNTDTYHS